jgi:hypothetical protein
LFQVSLYNCKYHAKKLIIIIIIIICMVPSRAIGFSLPKSPDRTVAHPTSCSVGIGDFVLSVKRPGLEADTHFLPVPKLETCEPTVAIPPMPL